MKSHSKRNLYWLQVFSSLAGIALSLYLLIQHTRINSGIQGSASFCSLGGFADCDVVNASQYSEVAGIPLATFGALFYFILLMLTLLGPPGDRNFRGMQRLMAWLAVAGLGVDLGLFVLQLVSLKSLCIMCFATYIATALNFGCNVLMAEPLSGNRLLSALSPSRGRGEIRLSSAAMAVSTICLVSFATVVALLPYYIRTSSHAYTMVENALNQFYGTWKDKPTKVIDAVDGDATRGNPAARVRVVEFSDFECPHCRRAAFTLHTALRPMEDEIYFIFKHYPLDSSCNPSLTYQMHPNACNLARLAYCATKKGKFWAYHDLVFLRMSDEEVHEAWSTLQDRLSAVFTKEEIAQCLQDEKSLQNVSESIHLGNSLGVKGTPSLYINGKLVTIPLTLETIRKLISLEQGM